MIAYGPPTRCPVLTYRERFVAPTGLLRAVRELVDHPRYWHSTARIGLRACYAMPGTEVTHAGTIGHG
eukprot:203848-Rhodomonas_salina.1